MKPNPKRKLRVFHGLANYGTQAGLFALELRKNNIAAISVVTADSFKRQIDVELLHGGNVFQKIFKHSYNWVRRFYWFFRYNTFHFYFGSSLFPGQADLPLYKIFGKKVIMEYLGWDLQLYQYSINKYKHTNALYYNRKDEGIAGDLVKLRRLEFESKHVNKQLVCAPYLSEFLPSAEVLPLAISLDNLNFAPKDLPKGTLKFLHAPTHRASKGSDFIEDAITKLKAEGFDIDFKLVDNTTHADLIKEYINCDIFIDQIHGGWYGTASIEAMAIGRPTVCCIREDYFEYINYGDKIPIINANPDTIYEVLRKVVLEKEKLPEIGLRSRKFVEEVHDVKPLTQRLITIYNSC
ncbi:MAG TPA: glycosyltransferase [Bacteroidales bacterium]|nr:glycosyltransferase [Bacteroidales bacterium]